MDFGLSRRTTVQTFIRYRPDTCGFVLYRAKDDFVIVDRMLLHIDFPSAEEDTSVGINARGTGILQFFPRNPPEIVERNIGTADPNTVGFVFDISSPCPVQQMSITDIGSRRFSSTFVGAKQSLHEAYVQYRKDTEDFVPGVPVFDTHGWVRCQPPDQHTYRPILHLVGYTQSLSIPLEPQSMPIIDAKRIKAIKLREAANRPRLLVKT